MNELRLGLLGMGNVGRHHAGCLLDGSAARCHLAAVASTSPREARGLRRPRVTPRAC